MNHSSNRIIKIKASRRANLRNELHIDIHRERCTTPILARIFATVLVCMIGLSVHGCSSVSPQQQFMNSLNRGNGAEASQQWLNMSAKDRANLSHNVGFKNDVSQDDVGRALIKHQREEAAKDGDDQDTAFDSGDVGSQQTEIPGLEGDPSANGISALPRINSMQQAAPVAP
jgi:hypothetical protein